MKLDAKFSVITVHGTARMHEKNVVFSGIFSIHAMDFFGRRKRWNGENLAIIQRFWAMLKATLKSVGKQHEHPLTRSHTVAAQMFANVSHITRYLMLVQ